MIEQLGPILSIVGGSKDVHHHEVLDIEMLSPLFQLVDVAATNALHLDNHRKVDFGFGGRHFVKRYFSRSPKCK